MKDITIKDLEKQSGIPVAEWKGHCYDIAVALVKLEQADGELEAGYFHYGDNMTDHGWVVYPDGSIADPTRWTMVDGMEPQIFRGMPDDCYDPGGVRYDEEMDKIFAPIKNAPPTFYIDPDEFSMTPQPHEPESVAMMRSTVRSMRKHVGVVLYLHESETANRLREIASLHNMPKKPRRRFP